MFSHDGEFVNVNPGGVLRWPGSKMFQGVALASKGVFESRAIKSTE